MKELLTKTCSFSDIFDDRNPENQYPQKEIMFVKADYFDHRWWPSDVYINNSDWPDGMKEEYTRLLEEFYTGFPTLAELSDFCKDNAEYIGEDEYNLFLTTEIGNYWIRTRLIPGDKNLYFHAYAK